MNTRRVLTVSVSAVFLLALVSSVRADSVRLPPGLEKLNLGEGQTFDLPETGRVDLTNFLAEHFANNNGRHQGFSVASFHGGLKFGLASPRGSRGGSVTQNPEPTGMLLLGTGLAAAAAFARRRTRKRRHVRRH